MNFKFIKRLGDGCLRTIIFHPKSGGTNMFYQFMEKIAIKVKEFWTSLSSNTICVYLLIIIGFFILMFTVLLVLLCVKTCCRRNRSLLSINKTMKRPRSRKNKTKKNSFQKEFTNIKAKTSPTTANETINEQLTKDAFVQKSTEMGQVLEIQNVSKQDALKSSPPPVVENEFQILRKQLLSNISSNNDNYESILNNNDFRRNYKYKY